MDQPKLKFIIISFLSLLLLSIRCKSNQKSSEAIFWCVDQFGQAVSNAKITIGNEEKSTNQDGMCIFKFNDNNQNLKLKAVKEGFFFLGPEEIYLESGRNIDYVISFLRSTKISVRAWKQSWNTETRRYYEREPFPGVEIVFEGKENQVTDDAGRLDLHLESEREGSVKIIARAYDSNLLRQKIEKVIRLKKDVFEYSEEFEFKEKKINGNGPPPKDARLVITSGKIKHTISGLTGGNASTPWEKHVFENIPVLTKLITIEALNKDPAKITLNLQPDCSDSLALNFNTRIIERWRKSSGQSYRRINSHEKF